MLVSYYTHRRQFAMIRTVTTLMMPICYDTSVTEKPRRFISIGVVDQNIIGKVLVEVRYPRCGHLVSGGEVAGVVAKVAAVEGGGGGGVGGADRRLGM